MSSPTQPTISGYRILERIGFGGSGVIYLAAPDSQPDARVAIKILKPGVRIRRKEILRFAREGRVAQGLQHPHILPVLELGECESGPYLVLEYVPGCTLQDRILRRCKLSQKQAPSPTSDGELLDDLRLLAQIAAALGFAHRHGIVHRDVKPRNVLIREDGHAFLIDFGLARSLDSVSKLTSSGVALGTPWYMAPEQIVGDKARIGPASDVYALGATIYETVCGRPPFSGKDFEELREKVLHAEPPDLRAQCPRVPPGLYSVVQRALEKEPEHRYPDADALREDLERAIQGIQPHSRRLDLVAHRYMRVLARKRLQIAGAAIVLLGLAALVLGWVSHRQQRRLSDERLLDHYREASYAAALGDLDDALQHLNAAREERPEDWEVEMRIAATYKLFELDQPAREALDRARQKGFAPRPEVAGTHDELYRGLEAIVRGDRIGAEKLLRSAAAGEATAGAAVDLTLPLACLFLYHVQRDLGHREDAAASLRRYVDGVRFGDPARYLAEAWQSEMRGEFDKAIAILEQAPLTDRSDALAYRWARTLGRIHQKAGHFAEAEQALRRALGFNDRDSLSWVNLGLGAFEKNEWELAIECAHKALAVDPHVAAAHALLGNIASRQGRIDAARLHFRDALDLLPDREGENLAEAHLLYLEGERAEEAQDYDLAGQRFRARLERHPLHFAAMIYLGYDAWVRRAQYAEAETWFLRAERAWDEAASGSSSTSALLILRSPDNLHAILVGLFANAAHEGHEQRARAALETLKQALDAGVRLRPNNALNLAEALAGCAIEALRDCARARSIVREEALEKAFPDKPEALEILAEIARLCPDPQ